MWVGQVGGVDVNLSTQIPSALWGRCLHVAYQEARSGFARTGLLVSLESGYRVIMSASVTAGRPAQLPVVEIVPDPEMPGWSPRPLKVEVVVEP